MERPAIGSVRLGKKRLGLVLGRFQPLHPGHLYLIDTAFKENDRIVICIGSAQLSEPLPIEKRSQNMKKQLEILGYDKNRYEIVELVDPEPMDVWPAHVKDTCRITDETENTFYRSDRLPKKYQAELEKLGFNIREVKRESFYHKAPDGFYRLVSSATEIRGLEDGKS